MLLRFPLNSVQQPVCKQVDIHHMPAGLSSLPASNLAPQKRSLEDLMGGGVHSGFGSSSCSGTTSIGFGSSSSGTTSLGFGERPSSPVWAPVPPAVKKPKTELQKASTGEATKQAAAKIPLVQNKLPAFV